MLNNYQFQGDLESPFFQAATRRGTGPTVTTHVGMSQEDYPRNPEAGPYTVTLTHSDGYEEKFTHEKPHIAITMAGHSLLDEQVKDLTDIDAQKADIQKDHESKQAYDTLLAPKIREGIQKTKEWAKGVAKTWFQERPKKIRELYKAAGVTYPEDNVVNTKDHAVDYSGHPDAFIPIDLKERSLISGDGHWYVPHNFVPTASDGEADTDRRYELAREIDDNDKYTNAPSSKDMATEKYFKVMYNKDKPLHERWNEAGEILKATAKPWADALKEGKIFNEQNYSHIHPMFDPRFDSKTYPKPEQKVRDEYRRGASATFTIHDNSGKLVHSGVIEPAYNTNLYPSHYLGAGTPKSDQPPYKRFKLTAIKD